MLASEVSHARGGAAAGYTGNSHEASASTGNRHAAGQEAIWRSCLRFT